MPDRSLDRLAAAALAATGEHLWMADTTTPAAIDAWLRVIEKMKGLAPAHVIAAHDRVADTSSTQLEFVRDYLDAYL